MILLVSRSNAGSARRDWREGSVGPSEGRATVTRSSLAFGLGLQSEIDRQVARTWRGGRDLEDLVDQ